MALRKIVLSLLGLLSLAYALAVLAYVYTVSDIGVRTAFDTTVKRFDGECLPKPLILEPRDRIDRLGGASTKTWRHLLQSLNSLAGTEPVEVTSLEQAGAETKIVSLKPGQIQGMHHADKGDKFDVDLTVADARPEEFDALMIPGGLLNPDALRSNEDTLEFLRCKFREIFQHGSISCGEAVKNQRCISGSVRWIFRQRSAVSDQLRIDTGRHVSRQHQVRMINIEQPVWWLNQAAGIDELSNVPRNAFCPPMIEALLQHPHPVDVLQKIDRPAYAALVGEVFVPSFLSADAIVHNSSNE